VSLLWPDRVGLGIYLDRLTWIRVRGRIKSAVVGAGTIPFSDSGPLHDRIRVAVEQLADLQRSTFPRSGAHFHPTLCIGLTRSAILPWSDTLISAESEEAIGRFTLERLYEDVDETWIIRCSYPSFGKPGIVFSLSRLVQSSIAETIQKAKFDLGPICPTLARASRLISSLAHGVSAQRFALLDDSATLLGALSDAGWLSITQTPRALTYELAMAASRRQAIIAGLGDDTPIYVGSPTPRQCLSEQEKCIPITIPEPRNRSDSHGALDNLARLSLI